MEAKIFYANDRFEQPVIKFHALSVHSIFVVFIFSPFSRLYYLQSLMR